MGWNPIPDLKHEWNKIKNWMSDRVKQARKDIVKSADSNIKRVQNSANRAVDKAEKTIGHVEDLSRDTINEISDVAEQSISELKEAGEGALEATEKAIQEAVDRLVSGGYKVIFEKLLELAHHATKGKKARVALTPFWFEVDLGDKIGVLEGIVADPPTDPKQIPDILLALVGDSEHTEYADVGIGFRFPVVGKVEVPIPIEVIRKKIEELV